MEMILTTRKRTEKVGKVKQSDDIKKLQKANAELLAALEAVTPYAFGHNKFGCEGKARDPNGCDICRAIWAARDAIAKVKKGG